MDLFNLTRPRCYFRLHYLSERLNFNYRVKSRVIFFLNYTCLSTIVLRVIRSSCVLYRVRSFTGRLQRPFWNARNFSFRRDLSVPPPHTSSAFFSIFGNNYNKATWTESTVLGRLHVSDTWCVNTIEHIISDVNNDDDDKTRKKTRSTAVLYICV